MGRTIDEVADALPADRRAGVERRAAVLLDRAHALAELSQAIAAASAVVHGPPTAAEAAPESFARFLSSLRQAIEASGGDFEVSVTFPSRPVLQLSDLAAALSWAESAPPEGANRSTA